MFPELTYRYPTDVNSPISDLTPEIVLDWSVDINNTQFSDDDTRAKFFVLMDELTKENLPTSYVSYTATTKRLILTPTNTLSPDKTYRILVAPLVASSDGRKSKNTYTWTFNTAVSAIGTVIPINPSDSTVQSTFPELSWYTVAGTGLTYEIQIDDSPIFTSLNYTTTTTSSSITPAGSFADNTTYYWRARAYSSTATGAWSDIWSFFYGTSLQAHVSSRLSWEDSDTFGVSEIGWKDGSSHLSAFPTISVTFTSTPSSSFSNYLTVRKKAVRPRNDSTTSYSWANVAGSWVLSNNVATFTPTENISTNTRYEIVIDRHMVNTDGTLFGEDLTYYFTGTYTPYYCDISILRAKFLSSELQIPDDIINLEIYSCSLAAHARYYGVSYGDLWVGDVLSEAMVRDAVTLKSFAVGKWVEATAYYNILRGILNETLRGIGRDRVMGNYRDSLSADFVKGIKLALDLASDDIKQYEDMLIPSHVARGTERNIRWSPNYYNFDWSIRDHEGGRHL